MATRGVAVTRPIGLTPIERTVTATPTRTNRKVMWGLETAATRVVTEVMAVVEMAEATDEVKRSQRIDPDAHSIQ
jgi:hypothetical protein